MQRFRMSLILMSQLLSPFSLLCYSRHMVVSLLKLQFKKVKNKTTTKQTVLCIEELKQSDIERASRSHVWTKMRERSLSQMPLHRSNTWRFSVHSLSTTSEQLWIVNAFGSKRKPNGEKQLSTKVDSKEWKKEKEKQRNFSTTRVSNVAAFISQIQSNVSFLFFSFLHPECVVISLL